jgi:hypothetical protein
MNWDRKLQKASTVRDLWERVTHICNKFIISIIQNVYIIIVRHPQNGKTTSLLQATVSSTRTNDYVMRKRKPSIKRSSILRSILRRENIKMKETYMRVEYMIQQDFLNSLLIEIKIDLAHRLRCEKIFVIDSDFPQSTSNLWQRLQKAAWIKEKNILHRRRFLELCFHAMNQDIIVFPADNFSYRRYFMRNVLNMKNTDELRLKLMKIPCDDLEPRYAFRSLLLGEYPWRTQGRGYRWTERSFCHLHLVH